MTGVSGKAASPIARDVLLSLAERCEAATGPDRAVDSAIVLALWPVVHTGGGGWYDPHKVIPGGWNYTASIDAAMTLLPEGFNWGVGPWEDWKDAPRRAWAWCDKTGEDWSDDMNCQAAAPALALCAASLRARAAMVPA